MHKRICPSCENDVLNEDFNTPFLCGNCLKIIVIADDNGFKALIWGRDTESPQDSPIVENSKPIKLSKRQPFNNEDFENNSLLTKPSFRKSESKAIKKQEEDVFDVAGRKGAEMFPDNKGEQVAVNYNTIQGKSNKTLLGVLIAIGLICLVGVSLIVAKLYSKGDNQVEISDQDNINLKEDEDLSLYLSLGDHEDAQQFLEEFLKCDSVEKAKKYVLPDSNIDSALEKYWQPRSFESVELIEGSAKVLKDKVGVVYLFRAKDISGSVFTYPVYYLKGTNIKYIGWRFAEQIEDASVSDIVSKNLTGVHKVRSLLVKEDYYNFGYDANEWISFNCYNSSSNLENLMSLRCYLKRNSESFEKIVNAFRKQSGTNILEKREGFHKKSKRSFLKPFSLYELEKQEDVSAQKPYARLIIELNVKDAKNGVAEISGFVCETSDEYFEEYQLPYLKTLE